MNKKTLHSLLSTILFLFSAFVFTSCLGNSNTTSSSQDANLFEKASNFNELSTFSAKVDSSNLRSMLSDSGAYTLFAPTNQAFSNLPDATLDTLSREELTEVLAYHVADTALFSSEFSFSQSLQSLQGEDIFISAGSQSYIINGGQLVGSDFVSTNGILHATNKVLLPDSYLDVTGIIAKRYELRNLNIFLQEAELISTLAEDTENGYTVFAPSNSAFDNYEAPDTRAALKDTLQYHVIPQKLTTEDFQSSQMYETLNGQELKIEVNGEVVIINDRATITTADLEGTNGSVHIINKVLAPPAK